MAIERYVPVVGAACCLIITGASVFYLILKRRQYNKRYSNFVDSFDLVKSLRREKTAIIALSAIQTITCFYQLIRIVTKSDMTEIINILSLLLLLITWSVLLFLSIVSPHLNQYKYRAYYQIFTVIFGLLFLDSLAVITFGEASQFLSISNGLICLVLFCITGSTRQPMHPRNLETVSYEKLEIKDGKVFRNDLALSPEATASIFSWVSFQWMNPLVVFGFRNIVTRDNIYALPFQQVSRAAYKDFSATKKFIYHAKILRRIYSCNKQIVWYQFIFSISACLISYLGPFFQQKFLHYVELRTNRPPIETAYMYIICLFLVGMAKLTCDNIQLYVGRRLNVRTLIMLDSEIYAKTLKRKDMTGKVVNDNDSNKNDKTNAARKQEKEELSLSNVGKVTNLMSVDADKLADIPSYMHLLYTAPVEVMVCMFYLYQLLGNAALVGLLVLLICFPITGYFTRKMSTNFTALTTAKDRRNELVNELLQGIRMIKFFAWEGNWKKKVNAARNEEMRKIIKAIVFEVLVNLLFVVVPVIVTACTFVWYTKVDGKELTASVAFVSITLFDMLRNPLIFVPEAINTLTEAHVSLKRISNYLEEPEIDDNINTELVECLAGTSPEMSLARVGFEQSTFQWHLDKSNLLSRDISNHNILDTTNPIQSSLDSSSTFDGVSSQQRKFQLFVPKFDFPTGKLTIVCGPTGSGKSSFLNALLGEMDIASGRVYLPSHTVLAKDNSPKTDPNFPQLYLDKVAYVAQQPFLQHASLRDNILFGLPYDSERYKKTLYQCALIKDLMILPDGDRTEIGEKGISLSGGQKQRVSLARAVYSYAKTVLLDDCLSAVDAHTSKHIFKKCLTGDLLKGRTVILVTHQVKLCLPSAHYLIRIEDGNLIAHDTVENLKSTGRLYKLVDDNPENDGLNETNEDEIEEIIDDEKEKANIAKLDMDSKTDVGKLVKEESSAEGQVEMKVYTTYLSACGGWLFWLSLICTFALARFLIFIENWWLRIWAGAYDAQLNLVVTNGFSASSYRMLSTRLPNAHTTPNTITSAIEKLNIFQPWVFSETEPIDIDYYIGVYVGICFAYILFDVGRNILMNWGSIRGARILFSSLLNSIIHAPMRFFDTTPVGRILNRFGKDVSTIDLQLAFSANILIECITGVIASILVITVITPQFLVIAIGVSCIYFIIGLFYLRISRELKRLNSVSRSPIYSHFTETLIGVTTIRAYGMEDQFMKQIYGKIDSYIAPFYYLWMSNRWLYARIEFTGAFVVLFTGLFLILNIDHIDAGMAGISLFYARSFLENIYWFIRQYTAVEMNLNSVERVQEYLELDQEPPAIIEGSRPPAAWPTTASVEVKDLVIRYAPELEPVLHGISFDIKPHEKVGIVGRTGSGKSTLALSFFRFLEASNGSISIDGIDISRIGVQDLRSKITIIPQDAVLFSGTIRSNLDPFEEYSDEEMWESLERAHLVKPSNNARFGQHGNGQNIPASSSTDSTSEERISSAIKSLTQLVSDGGNNFSQGQRQLLCLARALLKNSKLIIMDEATASVDFETDSKIQKTIREEFANSTLLCIAHRLRTVIDYDRVLVLDQGTVAEFDSPYNLIVRDSGVGIFKSMCEKSGEMEVLVKMATEAREAQQDNDTNFDNHSRVF
ncbi:hypothetical protein BDF20DRAFT_871958 [Mycotypha africana]|uniref:uncharacterized protein n=1 Tax=Mycotypha africana TaxID=64632 RepID=UPI002301453F|nr:uncharacterized protein BDF20DRAFT_871958 [Mycotypha africana]KAI8979837.1 hypothetical protein BDF20DRAFT_871958 [Mycotypha africana]